MRSKVARPDELVAEVAARQHGVVALEQLLEAGLTRSAIRRRVQAGRLHRVHRAVYAVGHRRLTREGKWLAAVLACGDGAVLGFRSAAVLWGISPTGPSAVDVVVPSYAGRRKRPGIKIHYTATLTARNTTRRNGIPTTTRARTLADLGFGQEPTRSDLERMFLRICERHHIAKPEVNARLGPYRVDFLWRSERLVVETDGYAYHSGRAAFEADRRRDRELRLRGYEVLRFTYREVHRTPLVVAASVRAHLRRRGPLGLTAAKNLTG